jgi:F-type H+-transporting ATPase subunit delta
MPDAAPRYAQAIFDIAVEQNRLEGWATDLATIRQAVDGTELRDALESVRAPFSAKQAAVEQIFGGQIDPLAKNFLLLLVQRNRLGQLDAIIDQFQALSDERLGIARAKVTTAVPLDDRERQVVADRLAAITGKTIRLEATVDPTIMGGLIARIGDKLIDGSTRTRLIALRRRLAAG